MASSTPPPHYSLTTSKPYQNHHHHHHNHRQTHQNWTSQKVSLNNRSSHTPTTRNAAKPPPGPTPTTTTTNPSFPSLSSLPPSKSELSSDFSGRRSTRFVSKMHFGRPKTAVASRHTSTAEEALHQAIRHSGDDRHIDGLLLNFEQKLCGTDDYTFLLRELGNRGEYSMAIRCFEFAVRRERRRNEQGKLASSMISVLGRLGKVDLAKNVFDTAVREGYGNTVYAYSALISAYAKSGFCNEAIKVLETMKNSGLKPNLVTYNALIDACGKGGADFNRASEIFDEMLRNGVQPDRITFNSLLAVCSGAGLWETAKNLFSEMVYRGIDQDIYTYNTLLDVACNGGHMNVAFGIIKLIDALCKKGLVESSALLLEEMTEKGIQPNVVTYNSIINAFGQSATGECLEGANESPAESSNSVVIRDAIRSRIEYAEDDRIINILEELAAENSCHSKKHNRGRQEIVCVLGVFQKMHDLKIKPNVVTFSAILNACSHCNSFEEASLLLEELRLFDNQVYGVAHGLLMGHRENVWMQALSLFNEVKQMDSSTASAFYNALTDMLWHFGQRRGAQLVVLEGKRHHVWENTWSDSCLDLHLMSSGAARAMVHAWLLNIRSIVFEGHELPKLLSILTGWGKHSKVVGDGTLKRAIETLLSGMGAPFKVAECNIGRFISSGALVTAWLRESGTLKVLILQDDRTQTEAATLDHISELQTIPL
ncbi:hypothetical protein ACSBR1_032268 [Camellia fascicularis]